MAFSAELAASIGVSLFGEYTQIERGIYVYFFRAEKTVSTIVVAMAIEMVLGSLLVFVQRFLPGVLVAL